MSDIDSRHDPTASAGRLEQGPLYAGRDLWRLLSLPLLLFLLLPVLAVALRVSPADLLANLQEPVVLQATALSLATTLATTFLAILLGTPLAALLARRRLPFRRLLDSLVDLPLVLPPAVAGVALLMAFGRRGLFGGVLESMGLHIAFTPLAVILAQLFVAAPFYVKAATLGFAAIDSEMKEAAALDGADGLQTFRYVTLPLAWGALLSGAIMTWTRALGEFGATLIFAGNYPGRTQTMPLAIYIGFELDLDVALTLSVILIGTSFLALLLVRGFLNREITR